MGRLDLIKNFMQEEGIDILLIPSEDPHLSEYPAEHWKIREYVSGFTGSNGFLLLSNKEDILWTDSRYYLQAEKELEGTGIKMYKEDGSDSNWKNWIERNATKKATIGFNGLLFSQERAEEIIRLCDTCGLTYKSDVTLPISTELPDLPDSKIFIHQSNFVGLSFQEKKSLILEKCKADYLLLCSLDEIAWTFNLRGGDTSYNPVFLSYAVVGKDESYLFVDNQKLDNEVQQYLNGNNIICLFSYESIFEAIETISKKGSISADPTKTNHTLYNKIESKNLVRETSPIESLKCIKTGKEIQCINNASVKDGVALVQAFYEIENRIKNGTPTSETDIADILRKRRSEQKDFFCESFATIAGYGANGAIVHYNAASNQCSQIGTDSLLLVDSGGNYLDGTTDITRVFCYGQPSQKQMDDYTHVLKGHLAICMCKFPKGTEGAHLNALAHQYLWREGLDYGHGTGHGIGYFLCVHEGPQRINQRFTGVTLKEGMILSDEPGLYRTGEYGIRIENMVSVAPFKKNEFGDFLQFNTITLFPYERKLINKSLLSSDEIKWINQYHREVYEKISVHLKDPNEIMWLKNVTNEL